MSGRQLPIASTSSAAKAGSMNAAYRIRSSSIRASQGAALVVVTVILLLVSMIAVTGASRSLLEQHLAANERIQTEAFFEAGAGVAIARRLANAPAVAQAVAHGKADRIEAAWEKAVSKYEDWIVTTHTTGSEEVRLRPRAGASTYWDADARVFRVVSEGRVIAGGGNKTLARRALAVSIEPARSAYTSPSPFVGALIGRVGVSIHGHSTIDIYDSGQGRYRRSAPEDSNAAGHNSDVRADLSGIAVRTCARRGDIDLTGRAPVYGDLRASGNISDGAATPIYGNIYARGRVGTRSGTGFNGHVFGNVSASESVALGKNAVIEGKVTAAGGFQSRGAVKGMIAACVATERASTADARILGGSVTRQPVVAACPVILAAPRLPPPAIRSAASITLPENYAARFPDIVSHYAANVALDRLRLPSVPVLQRKDAGCQMPTTPVIRQHFLDAWNSPGARMLSRWLSPTGAAQCRRHSTPSPRCYRAQTSGMTLYGDDENKLTLGAVGQKTVLKVRNNLDTANSHTQIDIKGDVTLLVDGNFDLRDKAVLHINASGSLKLLVTGVATFASDSDLTVDGPFVRTGTDGRREPAVMVYSAYESKTSGSGDDYGVIVGGKHASRIAVYAPLATVKVQGNGAIYGSVVSQQIDVTGSGDIHYDRSLRKISVDMDGTSARSARVKRWWQMTGT